MSFAPKICPNLNCHYHTIPGGHFIKKGHFRIQRLNQYIRRFQCKNCGRYVSSRTFKADYRHKKMDLNSPLAQLLVEGASLRAASRLLGLTYKNTFRKFLWIIKQASIEKHKLKFTAKELQFDELETIHHTKCKPLSIALFVNEQYQILSAQVAEMPAKGRLAPFSVKKYGPRSDHRETAMETGFQELKKALINQPEKCLSDAKPSYRKFVQKYFPTTLYETYSRADKNRYQDRLHEKLHKKKFDPLFALNQRCALLRSHIKRLTRRSWCTTKKPENLQGHLDLFIVMQFGWIV